MMKFCLPPKDAEEFKRQILSGEIDPLKLAEMTSAERHAFFTQRFGEAMAGPMNTLLESKLLLKNQQAGMVNWAQRMMGQNPQAQKDIVSKVKNMEKLLSPKDEDAFLAELAAHKLGTRISYEEAQKIADLSAKVDTAKASMANGGDRMDYGRAVVALQNYVGGLKRDAGNLKMADFKAHPFKTSREATTKTLKSIQGTSKSILSSFDNSALLRQGLPALLTHPLVWQKNARQSFVDLFKAFGSDTVTDEMMAEIVSRPTYDLMRQAKVDVGVREEAFPEPFPEQIPYLRAPFRASEAAYRGFQSRTRADLFDLYLKMFQKTGLDLDKASLLGIGSLVNNMTGRGHLGSLGEHAAPLLNSIFFSPRNMASKIHLLTANILDPTATGFAKKQGAINLAKILGVFALTFAIMKAINPSMDLSPTGPTFGKAAHKMKTQADVLAFAILDGLGMSTNTYKHGPSTVDLTGGMGGYVTLGTRIAGRLARWSKQQLGYHVPKEKRDTWQDVEHFFENKGAPGVQATRSIIQNRTFDGDKPTVGGIIRDLVTPMPVQNVIQLEQERARNSR